MALREFVLGDIPAIAAIRNASISISPDFYSMTVDRFRYDFYDEDVPMKSRIMVAEHEGRVAGFYHLYTDENLLARGRSNLDSIHVSPEARGKGIGTELMASIIETASEWGAGYVSTALPGDQPRSLEFLERLGFKRVRTFDKMRLTDLTADPVPELPAGYSLVTFVHGQDEEAFVAVFNQAFHDTWDFTPLKVSEVSRWNHRPSFNPRGCFLLWQGDQLVGFTTVLFNPERAEQTGRVIGRIYEMGVLPSHRQHGLGYLLLRVAIRYAREQGFQGLDLVTDEASPAGKQLYAKVGFQEKRSSVVLHRDVT
jgi:mycothiol synthase